jgi:hypothetical protein
MPNLEQILKEEQAIGLVRTFHIAQLIHGLT